MPIAAVMRPAAELGRGDDGAAHQVRGADEDGAEEHRDGDDAGVLLTDEGAGRVRCHETHEADRAGWRPRRWR